MMMWLLVGAVGWIVFAIAVALTIGKMVKKSDQRIEPCPLELEDAL